MAAFAFSTKQHVWAALLLLTWVLVPLCSGHDWVNWIGLIRKNSTGSWNQEITIPAGWTAPIGVDDTDPTLANWDVRYPFTTQPWKTACWFYPVNKDGTPGSRAIGSCPGSYAWPWSEEFRDTVSNSNMNAYMGYLNGGQAWWLRCGRKGGSCVPYNENNNDYWLIVIKFQLYLDPVCSTNNRLTAPTLVSPPDKYLGVPITPKWTYTLETNAYCFCHHSNLIVAANAGLTNVVASLNFSCTDNKTSSFEFQSFPPNNATVPWYYWSVRKCSNYKAGGCTTFPTPNSFCVAEKPLKPTITPLQLVYGTSTTQTINVSWTPSKPGFDCGLGSSITYTATLTQGSTTQTAPITAGLNAQFKDLAPGSYRVTVVATVKYGDTYYLDSLPDWFDFSVCQYTSPDIPQLQGPQSGALVNSDVLLDWTLSSWGGGCDSSSAVGSYMVYLQTPDAGVLSPYSSVTQAPLRINYTLWTSLGTAFWKVRAINAHSKDQSSETRSFTVCKITAPVSPSLNPPGSNLQSPVTITWGKGQWGSVCGSKNDQWILNIMSGTTLVNRSTITVTDESKGGQFTVSLGSGQYTAYLSATNGQGSSPNSTTTFSVCVRLSPSKPVLQQPSPSALIIGDSVTFNWTMGSWGESCGTTLGPALYLVLRNVKTGHTTNISLDSAGLILQKDQLASADWAASLVAVTTIGTTKSDEVEFTFCAPEPLSGFTGSATVVDPKAVFTFSTTSWGRVCGGATTQNNHFNVSYWKQGSPVVTVTTFTSDVTTADFTPTTGKWFWSIIASNGVSSKSQSGVFFFGQQCQQVSPTPPTGLTSVVSTGGDVSLSWGITDVGLSCTTAVPFFNVTVNGVNYFVGNTSKTTFTVSGLTTGTYTWNVTITNFNLTNHSASSSFEVCIPAMSVPVIVSPLNASLVGPDDLISWIPHWINGCELTKKIVLEVDGIGVTQSGNSTRVSTLGLSESIHKWRLVTSLGSTLTTSSAFQTFTYCVPSAPLAPSVIIPDLGVPPFSVNVTATSQGHNCQRGSPYYQAILTSSVYNHTFNFTDSNLTLRTIPTGTYQMEIQAFNGYPGLHSEIVQQEMKVCNVEQSKIGINITTTAHQSIKDSVFTLNWDLNYGLLCGASMSLWLKIGKPDGTSTTLDLTDQMFTKTTPITLNQGGNWTFELALTVSIPDKFMFTTSSFASTWACEPEDPISVGLVSPGPSEIVGSYISDLRWNITTSETCGLLVGPTRVYVQPVSSSTVTSIYVDSSMLFKQFFLTPGLYDWWIGYPLVNKTYAETPKNRFTVCITSYPSPPRSSSVSPSGYIYSTPGLLINLTVPAADFGVSCTSITQNKYELLISAEGSTPTKVFQTLLENETSSGVTFTIPNKTANFLWSVRVTNEQGYSAASTVEEIFVCHLPSTPTLKSPTNWETNVETLPLTLSWNTIYWGACTWTNVNKITILWALVPSNYSLNGTVVPTDIALDVHNYTGIGGTGFELPIDDSFVNSTYIWQIQISNGVNTVLSPIQIFTTRVRDCRSVDCGIGSCIPSTLQCQCRDDTIQSTPCLPTSGTKTNVVPIVVPIVVVVVGLIGGGIAFIFLLSKWRKSKDRRRVILEAPEDSLKFSDLKVPLVAPSIPASTLDFAKDASFGFPVAMDIAAHTDLTDSDNVAKALVYAYERHGAGLRLVEALISFEIGRSENPDVIFRNNSLATKAFKFYSKIVSLGFLYATFGALFEELLQAELDSAADKAETEEASRSGKVVSVRLFSEGKYEVDPDKMGEQELEDLNMNVLQLCLTTQKFMTQIFRSASHLPPELNHIMSHLESIVADKFHNPQVTQAGVGAFIFLRLLNVAISVPEFYGLLKKAPSPSMRRALVLVAKILQNLSTETQFGNKEGYMTNFNELLQNNFEALRVFYKEVATPREGGELKRTAVPDKYYHPAVQVLLGEFAKNQKPAPSASAAQP